MELALKIEKGSAVPIYAQLRDQIQLLVHRGVLEVGDMMPTVRTLAVDLGINSNTVARVYRDLQGEGLLRLERGVGSFVTQPSKKRAVDEKDFRAVSKKARNWIALCKRAGLRSSEATQLIEILWKEKSDAQG
jgi:GntR family transcriptional regulator